MKYIKYLALSFISFAFIIIVSQTQAYAHTDENDILNTFSCEVEESHEVSTAEAYWWWCYENNDRTNLLNSRNSGFSLSLKVDVYDESGENLVISCEGETSTKTVGALSDDGGSREERFDERVRDACEVTGGACGSNRYNCHVTGVDVEEVFCPDGNESCLETNHEDCDEVAQDRDNEGNEESVVYTGDVKAIHAGGSGRKNTPGDGNGQLHNKAIMEGCPEF